MDVVQGIEPGYPGNVREEKKRIALCDVHSFIDSSLPANAGELCPSIAFSAYISAHIYSKSI